MIVDVALINLAYIISYYFRFETGMTRQLAGTYLNNIIIIALIYIVFFLLFRLYESLWTYASIDEFLLAIAGSILSGFVVLILTSFVFNAIPISINILACVLITIFTVGFRMSFRIYRRTLRIVGQKECKDSKRVMIIGAGEAGNVILKEMFNSKYVKMNPICFIDDNKRKLGTSISGVKVLGNRYDIKRIAEEKAIDQIVISIPTLTQESKKQLIKLCSETNCEVKIMPGIYELINGDISISKMRNVEVEDLLGREPIKLDSTEINSYLKDKTVLVTGGGGSIGSEIARQIVKFKPKKLIILDIYENNAYDLEMELLSDYKNLNLRVIIASVRDIKRLDKIFNEENIDVVFHAAAHKHVPLMENNPTEAVKNNVFGTYNITQVADKYKVKKFVMISTDKAVNPTNVMGATKRACEMIIQAMDKKSQTSFVAVRFGNVLGSNGSVIPLFKKQMAKGGPVTVTHKDIIRYFMTIPEAAQLVLQAGAYAKGGEIFVLDMGSPVRIYDLACDLIKLSGYKLNQNMNIEVTGLRPGEKLYEELLMAEEGLQRTKSEKIFVGNPSFHDIKELEEHFEALRLIIENGTKEELIQEIQKLVPTYKRVCYDDLAESNKAKEEVAAAGEEK